jgi:hypothetical protein
MGITAEQVSKALEEIAPALDGEISKASESDLDQPEGADMGYPSEAKKPMSDEAKSKMMSKKKAYKAEVEEDEEDEEEEDMDMDMKAKKSFSDGLSDEVQSKIEVSEFLRSLVEHTGDTIEDLRLTVAKSQRVSGERIETLAKSLDELHANQAKIGIVLKAICEKIGVIENTPHQSKAVTKSEGQEELVDRTFKSALETENEEPIFKGLSDNPIMAKSQITNAMLELVKSGNAEDVDVINFESSGFISPEIQSKLKNHFNG